mgnify:CR=1 FL=1
MSNVVNLANKRPSYTMGDYIHALEDASATNEHRKTILRQLYAQGYTGNDVLVAIENIL